MALPRAAVVGLFMIVVFPDHTHFMKTYQYYIEVWREVLPTSHSINLMNVVEPCSAPNNLQSTVAKNPLHFFFL